MMRHDVDRQRQAPELIFELDRAVDKSLVWLLDMVRMATTIFVESGTGCSTLLGGSDHIGGSVLTGVEEPHRTCPLRASALTTLPRNNAVSTQASRPHSEISGANR